MAYMAYQLIWQLTNALFMLKSRLDGPLACLVRSVGHPSAKMYIVFPYSRLDGSLACPVRRLVIPLLKLYITFAPLNTATVHGIPTYLATY
jgi:hypothetical protein